MLVQNQLVKIGVNSKTIGHYRSLGYNIKSLKDQILVSVEHLTNGSHAEVAITCDICGKLLYRPYKRYLSCHSNGIDTCNECKIIKTKQTCLEKYGVESVFQVEEFKEKHKQTCLEKYGYEYISQIPEIREKIENTFIDKYGETNPMCSDIVKNKVRQTNLDKYGVENPMQNKEIQQKAQNTNIIKYGVPVAIQNKTIKSKAIKTLYKNNSIPTSSQQLKIYNMVKAKYLNAELNYPFSSLSLDIFISVDNINIDIEYDGRYWHQDQQADIRRDKFLQSKGFKVIRIRSGHKLPAEEQLFSAIDELVTTDRMFKEIILSDWNAKQYKINENKEVSV